MYITSNYNMHINICAMNKVNVLIQNKITANKVRDK